jgi:hypothetical protein
MIALLKYLHESPDQVISDAERLMNINPVGPYCYIRSIFSALRLTLTRRAIFPRQIYLYLLSHPDLRTNPNARIHVRQDQVTHMHRRSEYQNTV